MEKQLTRDCRIDVVRIAACFFVIVNHSVSSVFLARWPNELAWWTSLTLFFFSKSAVPNFFMITGFLLLGKQDSWKKTLSRVFRIAVALFCAAACYEVIHAVEAYPNTSKRLVLEAILKIHRQTPVKVLWYLYTYLGILLMMPFLQKMTSQMEKRDYHIFFLISGFFIGLVPILERYFPWFSYSPDFYIPLFGANLLYLMIGQYFRRFGVRKTRAGFWTAVAIVAAAVVFSVTATYFECMKDGSSYLYFDDTAFLTIMLQSTAWFYLASFVKVPAKAEKLVTTLGSATFGIYLVVEPMYRLLHPVFQTLLPVIGAVPAMLVYEVSIFTVGFLVVWLLKKIPGVKRFL